MDDTGVKRNSVEMRRVPDMRCHVRSGLYILDVMRSLTCIALAAVSGLAACGFSARDTPTDAPDATADSLDANPACISLWSFTPSNFTPCIGEILPSVTLISGSFTFTPQTGLLTDGTSTTMLPTPVGSPRVLSVAGLDIGSLATLEILGPDPLVIAVYGNARISGVATASARGTSPGGGAASCAGSTGTDAHSALSKSAGGGGGGGGFGTIGAAGGTGDTSIATKTPGGGEMGARGTPMMVPLFGGCNGGTGGQEHNTAVATPGAGGGGGGAIQISVRDAFVLAGTARVEASGGGGQGADGIANGAGTHEGAGGGGGGSGGAIFLEGTTITIAPTVTLCANGGGGGGGSHNTNDGGSGADGPCSVDDAAGGTSDSTGVGGFGATLNTNSTIGGNGGGQDAGGGGGGGGGGRIRVRATSGTRPAGFVASPAPSVD